MIMGCGRTGDTLTHAPFEHQVGALEGRFNDEVVLDTTTVEDEERSSVLDEINPYMDDMEIITGADSVDGPDGGTGS